MFQRAPAAGGALFLCPGQGGGTAFVPLPPAAPRLGTDFPLSVPLSASASGGGTAFVPTARRSPARDGFPSIRPALRLRLRRRDSFRPLTARRSPARDGFPFIRPALRLRLRRRDSFRPHCPPLPGSGRISLYPSRSPPSPPAAGQLSSPHCPPRREKRPPSPDNPAKAASNSLRGREYSR